MLFCEKCSKMKENSSNSEARQVIAASKRTLDQLFRYIRQGAALSLSHDWIFTRQLLSGWSAFIDHVMIITIEARKATAKLPREVR